MKRSQVLIPVPHFVQYFYATSLNNLTILFELKHTEKIHFICLVLSKLRGRQIKPMKTSNNNNTSFLIVNRIKQNLVHKPQLLAGLRGKSGELCCAGAPMGQQIF